MSLVDCPKCGAKLAPPLKTSGRQICSACGWTGNKTASSSAESLAVSSDPSQISPREILEVAENQKYILWLFLLNAIVIFFGWLPRLIVGFVQIFFIYKLAIATRQKPAILYAFLMLVPLISLLVLLSVNARATAILQRNGIRVGLMGANQEDLAKFKAQINGAEAF